MLQIAYIAGYGRSGSTLLDVLIGALPGTVGAGELRHLFREAHRQARCSCGSLVTACPVWRPALQPGTVADWRRYDALTQHLEALGGRWRGGREAHRMYGRIWERTLRAISQAGSAATIVDSSKSARDAWHRLRLLTRFTNLPLRAIHLVRDPRAVAHSLARGSNRALEQGQPAVPRAAALRAAFNWLLVNWAVERQLRQGHTPHVRVRYEDLVARPGHEMGRIGRLLGLEPAPVIAALQSRASLPPGHGLAGNRMRRRGAIHLTADRDWRQRTPKLRNEVVMAITGVLAKRYGYL